MEARFRIFKAPFYFVGWLAPAYGIDKVNPNGITFPLLRQTFPLTLLILPLPLQPEINY
jgi:hypothetical protein